MHGLTVVARAARRDYLAVYGLKSLIASTVPRSVLQPLFLAYLGYLAGGLEGRRFAIIGACVHVLSLATVVKAADSMTEDQAFGTLDRVRTSRPGLTLVQLTRCWIYLVEAVASALVAVVGVCAYFGEWRLMVALLQGSGLFVLIALSATAFGLAVAAVAALHPASAVLTNLAVYALLVLCGIIAPVDRLAEPVGVVSQMLPLTHGAESLRALADGRPWAAQAALEALVGVAWLAVGLLMLRRNDRRARRLATDS
ncbi:ABC transporter permease [Streptomyces caelestis]|uniref:ABC-type polysaccharide/polyol phosphate export permease n=1 Tax=Streptomyces caelestis TaxID=36816 RepID=A0A7W9LR29_9ACTN|nr:ABC transporter permease [Streptomyces caelestis]MBB5792914.1 ABC-type polysaccharide/polyol phosphate export permease [Streptomyces caelestis]